MKIVCICRWNCGKWTIMHGMCQIKFKSIWLVPWLWATDAEAQLPHFAFVYALCWKTALYMTERLKSEWIYTLGHHPSIFTETGTAAPRSSLSPTAPWQIVCFTLFTSSRLSSEKRHDNLLCAHWRWIVITPQAMQMLLSASRSRPVLPPAGRLCRPCRPCRPRVLPPHTQTYLRVWPQRFRFQFSVSWTPEIPILNTIWARKSSASCWRFAMNVRRKSIHRGSQFLCTRLRNWTPSWIPCISICLLFFFSRIRPLIPVLVSKFSFSKFRGLKISLRFICLWFELGSRAFTRFI